MTEEEMKEVKDLFKKYSFTCVISANRTKNILKPAEFIWEYKPGNESTLTTCINQRD